MVQPARPFCAFWRRDRSEQFADADRVDDSRDAAAPCDVSEHWLSSARPPALARVGARRRKRISTYRPPAWLPFRRRTAELSADDSGGWDVRIRTHVEERGICFSAFAA